MFGLAVLSLLAKQS